MEIKGFVLQINPVKEQDCYLQVLTKNMGYLAIYVKGGLNIKNQLHQICQLFQLITAELYQTKKSNYLQHGEVLASFPFLVENLQQQAFATKMAHLVRDLAQVQDSNDASLYEILAYALHAMNQADSDGELLLALANLRFLAVSGFALPLEVDGELLGNEVYLDHLSFRRPHPQSQVLHPPIRHWKEANLPSPPLLNQASKDAISFVLSSPLPRMFRLRNLSLVVRQQVIEFSRHFVAYCLEKDYQGDQLLHQLQEMEQLAQNLWQRRLKKDVDVD